MGSMSSFCDSFPYNPKLLVNSPSCSFSNGFTACSKSEIAPRCFAVHVCAELLRWRNRWWVYREPFSYMNSRECLRYWVWTFSEVWRLTPAFTMTGTCLEHSGEGRCLGGACRWKVRMYAMEITFSLKSINTGVGPKVLPSYYFDTNRIYLLIISGKTSRGRKQ